MNRNSTERNGTQSVYLSREVGDDFNSAHSNDLWDHFLVFAKEMLWVPAGKWSPVHFCDTSVVDDT